MKRFPIPLWVVCFVVLLILLPAIGPATHWKFGFGEPSKAEREAVAVAARKDAIHRASLEAIIDFACVRSQGNTGDGARECLNRLYRTANEVNVTAAKLVKSTNEELEGFVQAAYARDTEEIFYALKTLKANPDRAEELRREFLRARGLSNKPLSAYVANMNVVNELVARNYIQAAAKQGVRLSARDLRKAGIVIGTPRAKHVVKAAHRPAKAKLVKKPRSRVQRGR